MRTLKIWAFPLLALSVLSPLRAQDTQPVDAFKLLFPHPTGSNGYEEWVKAGALASRNERAQSVTKDPRASASDIRALLQESDIQQARTLFYAGMAKPAFDPRTEINANTLLPEFPLFRAYARLLAKEIVLDIAEGKNDEAIKCLQTGLEFGRRVQQKTLLSGLVGVAIDALVLAPFNNALETFSAKDCDALLGVVKEWLQEKSPAPDVLSAEEGWARSSLQKLKETPTGLMDYLRDKGVDEGVIRALQSNGVDPVMVITQADRKLDAYFQTAIEGLKAPAYQRKPVTGISDESLPGRIAGLFCPPLKYIGDPYSKLQSRVQAIGIRCLLRRFHLGRNRYPNSVAELNAGALGIDPFTAKPFEYHNEGALYVLKPFAPKREN